MANKDATFPHAVGVTGVTGDAKASQPSMPSPVSPVSPTPLDPALAAWVATLDDDALELFNERAGIREFDGGLSRREAESAAQHDVLRWLNARDGPFE